MRVATFNLHAGVDGWGRESRALNVAKDLDADVLVLPEMWRADEGPDFFEELTTSFGLTGAFAPLARCERIATGVGGPSWQPRLAHFTGERGLYFGEHRALTKSQLNRRAETEHVETGTWGLALVTRFTVEDIRVIALGRLPREKVQRAIIVGRLRDGDQSFHVVAVHGAHLSHGSHRQYQRIATIVDSLDPALPVLLGGDFNCWRPLLRLWLPGWRTLARGKTWPAPRPHSQIDHLLGRGAWRSERSYTRDGGSDHLALVAEITLAPQLAP